MSGSLFRGVEGQEAAESLVGSALSAGRLAHAYLFAGPRGTGRLSAALCTAAAFMCGERESGWCGECRDCRRIPRFQHPDVWVTIPASATAKPEEISTLMEKRAADGVTPLVLPGNQAIGIDTVRSIQARLAMRPYEGRARVEILLDVDRMRQEAANALLKTLEEPPADTLIVLTAERASAVIPTVRSRAHLVRFRRLPVDLVAEIVARRTGLPGPAAMVAASRSDGSPGAALLAAAAGDSFGETVGEALAVLSSSDPSRVLTGSREMAKSLGSAGISALCPLMVSVLHDMRRRILGKGEAFNPPGSVAGHPGWGAGELGEAADCFSLCERRLQANVIPGAAFTAAMTNAWATLRRGGDAS